MSDDMLADLRSTIYGLADVVAAACRTAKAVDSAVEQVAVRTRNDISGELTFALMARGMEPRAAEELAVDYARKLTNFANSLAETEQAGHRLREAIAHLNTEAARPHRN